MADTPKNAAAANRLIVQHNRAAVGDPPEGGTFDYAANTERWKKYAIARNRTTMTPYTPEERDALSKLPARPRSR